MTPLCIPSGMMLDRSDHIGSRIPGRTLGVGHASCSRIIMESRPPITAMNIAVTMY